jgi:hypothetical protein
MPAFRRLSFRRSLLALIVLAAGAVACGGPLDDAEDQFRQGQYPAAKQTLAATEAESRTWDPPTRAEYALYRGLTLAALGDRGAAAWWLRRAKAAEDAAPGTLSPDDADRLAVSSHANFLP